MTAGPSVPEAPGLLSMMMGWPRCLAAASAIVRMAMSVDPPAGHGTTSVTGFSGYPCASIAVDEHTAIPAADRAAARKWRRYMLSPSLTEAVSGRHLCLFLAG